MEFFDEWMPAREAARQLGVSRSAINHYWKAHRLRACCLLRHLEGGHKERWGKVYVSREDFAYLLAQLQPDEREWISVTAAATLLSLRPGTVRMYLAQGKLTRRLVPAFRKAGAELVYLRRSEIEALPESRVRLRDFPFETTATVAELSYLAGILDGEGSISILPRKVRGGDTDYFLRIQVVNTHLPMLQWLEERYGGGVCKKGKPPHAHHRQGYIWALHARAAGRLLEMILPYLVIKSEQAAAAIEFQSHLTNYPRHAFKTSLTLQENEWRARQKELVSSLAACRREPA